MNCKRVGLISTMAPDNTWAIEVLNRVSHTHGIVKHILEDMGFDVLDDGPLKRSYKEMMSAGRSLRAKGINALVIYVGTWTYANCAVAAAIEADVPVIIWGDATPGTCGLVGSAIVRGGMAEYGIYAKLIYGAFDDEKTKTNLKRILNASCAAKGLRGQVMGIGGGRSMGMVTATCDPNEIREKFGVEIDSFEQLEIIDRAEKMHDEKPASFLCWLKETFGEVVPDDDIMLKQIKLYLALTEFCKEKDYDFVAVKCLPELPGIYTTFCLAHAIMGDKEDCFGPKERFVFACEADINAALTMQILKALTDSPVLFTDLTEYSFCNELLTTCNCGSQPTDFAKSKKEVCWEREGVHEFCWKFGGTCPQHVSKSGRATVARLYRNKGNYEMFIAPAEVVEMPREKLKETIWERPHTFIRLLCDRDSFFNAIRSNHLHLVYGDCMEELQEVCTILGINPVVIS